MDLRHEPLSPSSERVPPHLRKYVVEQNLAEYNEVDQAVWRFVMLQLHHLLRETAHPAYADGLRKAGISVDRIPTIAQMDTMLESFGWGAVCVDGFIPPLAFQEFQARGILPISGNIRTLSHLVYTPAPDILHEAAGHAPILCDAAYAAYVRRIGRLGALAFGSRQDAEVHEAVYTLSEIKEDPAVTPKQLARAEERLKRILASVTHVTEAQRLSRLYWWTAEYGLVGNLADYRLYGAGLLSSLSESHFCHRPEVLKLPLSVDCLDVPYDITQPQPQLFVARDFEHLEEVLTQVEPELAYFRGGRDALEAARSSESLATFEFEGGFELAGLLRDFSGEGDPEWLLLEGDCAWIFEQQVLVRWQTGEKGMVLPLGTLELHRLPEVGTEVELRFDRGIEARGRVANLMMHRGQCLGLTLQGFALSHLQEPLPSYDPTSLLPVVFSSRLSTARPGAPGIYYPATVFSTSKVPRPRRFTPKQRQLLELYEQARAHLRENLGSAAEREIARLHAQLSEHFPHDWLLRWNLLERLLALGLQGESERKLRSDLQRLELEFAHREPILSGLRYLEHAVLGRPGLPD